MSAHNKYKDNNSASGRRDNTGETNTDGIRATGADKAAKTEPAEDMGKPQAVNTLDAYMDEAPSAKTSEKIDNDTPDVQIGPEKNQPEEQEHEADTAGKDSSHEKAADKQIENLREENGMMLDRLRNTETELEMTTTELRKTKDELAKSRDSYEEQRAYRVNIEKELYELRKEKNAMQKELDDLKTELGCTESADSGQQKGLFGIFKLSDQVGSLKNSLKEANEHGIELRNENAHLREQNSEYATRFELQKESNKRLTLSNESLTKENLRLLSENKSISSELEKEQRRIYDFEEENNYYSNQLKKFQTTEPKLKSVIDTLMNQFGLMYNAVLNSESYEELKKINEFSTTNTINLCKSAGFMIHMHERGVAFNTEYAVNPLFIDTDNKELNGKVKECTEFGYIFNEDQSNQFFKMESADIYRYKEPETEPAKEAAEEPAEVPEEAAEEKAITEAPAEAKEEVPAEVPSDVPDEVAEEEPAEIIADEAPAEAVKEAPAEVPEEVTQEEPAEKIADEAPAEAVKEAPAEKPVDEDAEAEADTASDHTYIAEAERSDDAEEKPKEEAPETEDVPEVSPEKYLLDIILRDRKSNINRIIWFTDESSNGYARSVSNLVNVVEDGFKNNKPARYIYIPYEITDEDHTRIKKYEDSGIRFIVRKIEQRKFKNTIMLEEFIEEFQP